MATATDHALAHQRPGPRPVPWTDESLAALAAYDPCPAEGAPLDEVLERLGPLAIAPQVRPADPLCVAHLHCPPLLPAVAAELLVALGNQSLDSFDQAPAATHAELRLTGWLAGELGLGAAATGVMTAGGTASNLLALYLARARALQRLRLAPSAALPPQARGWCIVTSDAAHDSIVRAAVLLGLGAEAVVPVATGPDGALDPAALTATLAALAPTDRRPIALVATAGTTDLGAIDPLPEMAAAAAAHDAWFHVDAAVGSALVLSSRLRERLAGIERADSVTADFHKLWWMPLAASALVVRDPATLAAADHHSDYLNRHEDVAAGVVNLVGRSLDTSRRFDALKVLVALACAGRARLGGWVEDCVALAGRAAELVRERAELELVADPSTVMCAFRWVGGPGVTEQERDRVNAAVAAGLFADGQALIGRSRRGGRTILKLTLINPLATERDLTRLFELVSARARAEQRG